jgi:hypothetical protein
MAEFGAQLAQTQQEADNLRKVFLDDRMKFPFTSDPLGGLVSHLMAKWGGNIHGNGVVEITASSLIGSNYAARNAADLGDKDSRFQSQDTPGQWICWDFKTLRIETTHYTIGRVHMVRLALT